MRAEKQLLLDEIVDKIKSSKGFVVAGYKDFSAMRSREFRGTMATLDAEFEVVRKRVFVKAAQVAGIKLDADSFTGHVGVIFAYQDPLQLTKSTVQYSEENEQLKVLGGQIEGEIYSAEEMNMIAKLPSLAQLRSEVLGLFEAPMAQTVGVVQSMLTSPLYCLEEQGKKG